MISICIPIYNFNVSSLVEDLIIQGNRLNIPYEIILIDDASTDKYKALNEDSCSKASYYKLVKNIGRAKIRNLFLEYSSYDNLLFLDCDSLIISDKFLSNYVTRIQKKEYNLIFGGRVYPKKCPSREKNLSWKYGTNVERKTVIERNKEPNKSFMTNNFVIKKSIFEKIKFNEELIAYGHEDTLFGFQLLTENIEITHINNPILNGDIEDNSNYVRKTEEGIKNLILILNLIPDKKDFIENVHILKFHKDLKSRKLFFIYKIAILSVMQPIRFFLVKGFVNLKAFNLFKLGFLMKNYK
jgi:glycosyltransferase involved in cell wall biosynthesis